MTVPRALELLQDLAGRGRHGESGADLELDILLAITEIEQGPPFDARDVHLRALYRFAADQFHPDTEDSELLACVSDWIDGYFLQWRDRDRHLPKMPAAYRGSEREFLYLAHGVSDGEVPRPPKQLRRICCRDKFVSPSISTESRVTREIRARGHKAVSAANILEIIADTAIVKLAIAQSEEARLARRKLLISEIAKFDRQAAQEHPKLHAAVVAAYEGIKAAEATLVIVRRRDKPQPDDKAHDGHGENKEEKHNPTLITGEDFAAPTFIVRRFSFSLHVLLSRASVDEARGGPLRITALWHPKGPAHDTHEDGLIDQWVPIDFKRGSLRLITIPRGDVLWGPSEGRARDA